MRKVPFLAVAAVLVGVTVVALASASRNASTPASWLPTGVTPAGANWISGEGDESNSRYSPLRQINVEQRPEPARRLEPAVQHRRTSRSARRVSRSAARTTCSYQTYIQGVAAMEPDTGEIAWNYTGPASAQLTQLGQRLRNDNARTTSYSSKLNLVYAASRTARSSR